MRITAFLKPYPISAIYASDLSRAMDTARPIADFFGLPITPDKRLREVHAGQWQRKGFDYLDSNEDYKRWRTGSTPFAPRGGESIEDVYIRTDAAIQEIVAKHVGETIAVVTHATPIRVLKTKWQRIPLAQLQSVASPPNASVTVVRYRKDGTQEIVLYAENQFLGELSAAPTTQM